MEKRIIECVPNFSEGRDMNIIKQITAVIESIEGVKLLDVDPGKDTNRTVVTFVGEPDPVSEAAFQAVKKASELIDMSKHHGEHPRMGATDVCPLVPVSGITIDETAEYARNLAKKIGDELAIPVFCYENAAFEEKRRNLANCRAGEYEGLKEKLADPEWKPDFGPSAFNVRSGATAVGARDFLVAFNANLNTTSVRRANAIAFDIREKGREVRNEQGEIANIPGTLKSVKAIGWYIEEYGIAQISMNITNISVTPVHIAFDEVCRKADSRGIRVTGSELVGLIPLKAMLDAGRYFLEKQQRSTGVSDEELIKIAVKSMGLNDIHPFNPHEKIIEFVMGVGGKHPNMDTHCNVEPHCNAAQNYNVEPHRNAVLREMSLYKFMNKTASESPAPGGGSVSAYIGTLGVALGTMVANLSSHKKGWDHRWKEFSEWAEKGKAIQNKLLKFVDEDTEAFNKILDAYKLPKKTEEDIQLRNKMVQQATKNAALVPFRVMETAFSGFELIRKMVETGNPESITDAAVGSLAIRSCIRGAFLNVKINSAGINDKELVTDIIEKGHVIENKAFAEEEEIIKKTEDLIKFRNRS